MRRIVEAVGVVGAMTVAVAWSLGGVAGAIYWAVEDDLLNVVLSLIVPLYGAISMLLDLLW